MGRFPVPNLLLLLLLLLLEYLGALLPSLPFPDCQYPTPPTTTLRKLPTKVKPFPPAHVKPLPNVKPCPPPPQLAGSCKPPTPPTLLPRPPTPRLHLTKLPTPPPTTVSKPPSPPRLPSSTPPVIWKPPPSYLPPCISKPPPHVKPPPQVKSPPHMKPCPPPPHLARSCKPPTPPTLPPRPPPPHLRLIKLPNSPPTPPPPSILSASGHPQAPYASNRNPHREATRPGPAQPPVLSSPSPPYQQTCPIHTLKLGASVDVLGGLTHAIYLMSAFSRQLNRDQKHLFINIDPH